ncbi:DUF4143 domain-containing protein [Nonomuraea sp. CA-218870]|uniref:DUF4143 domain-containing protein n=1 Tax=Nonomuraea sp. CA-218870 TaxID=3239998 RepID=UPI003D8ACA88
MSSLISRDVRQLSEIQRMPEARNLLKVIAARSGQLLKANALSLGNRVVGMPKVAFVDSGVAANLLGTDTRGLVRPGSMFGPLLEGFVLMEIARQLTWAEESVDLFPYRTKDQVEVDAVVENRQGRVGGSDAGDAGERVVGGWLSAYIRNIRGSAGPDRSAKSRLPHRGGDHRR